MLSNTTEKKGRRIGLMIYVFAEYKSIDGDYKMFNVEPKVLLMLLLNPYHCS